MVGGAEKEKRAGPGLLGLLLLPFSPCPLLLLVRLFGLIARGAALRVWVGWRVRTRIPTTSSGPQAITSQAF
jgi:hypothetical protein